MKNFEELENFIKANPKDWWMLVYNKLILWETVQKN